MSHFPGFNIRSQPLPCRAVKVAAGITVIGIVDNITVALLLGVTFEVFFLIDNGVAIPGQFIVTGQSFI